MKKIRLCNSTRYQKPNVIRSWWRKNEGWMWVDLESDNLRPVAITEYQHASIVGLAMNLNVAQPEAEAAEKETK